MNEKYGIELDLITGSFDKKINQIKKQIDSTFDPNDISGMKINNKPLDDYIVKIKGARTELGKFSKINNIQTPKVDTASIENITKTIEESTSKVEPITNRFNECINKIKRNFGNVKSEPINIDIDVEDAEIDLLKYKISELEEKLQNAGKMHLSTKEIVETRAKLAKLNIEYDRLIQKEDESSSKGRTAFNSLQNGIEKTVSKIKRFALSLFSIRSIYSLLSRASSAYMAQDTTLANKMQAVWIGLGAILEPIISGIVNILLKGVKYINIFIKALTGVDLLAKATSKSLGGTTKSAKALNKALAGFDELNNLDTTSDVGNAGVGSGWADAFNDVEIDTDWAEKIKNFGKWLKENWKPIVIGIGVIVGALLGFKIISSIIKLFSSLKKSSNILKGFTGDFTGLFNGIGKATEAIAILGGIALVINQVTGLIKVFSESGLSLSDVAILLGSVLGELAVAFTIVAAATNLMDWQGIAGAAVILGGFAIVITTVTKLLDVFSKSGLTVGEVAGLMASIFGTLIILMGAIALLGPAMTAGLVPFSIVVAGVTALLIVMSQTIPVILEALGKFINNVAPSIKSILETIGKLITNIIYALGDTLPPIIDSVGRLFEKIFNGISKVISTVGDVIVKILNTAKDLVDSVLRSILNFINDLGPAINNFVDNVIRAVTKLVNFVVSAIEYLVNRVVDGLNGIASVINMLPGVNISKKSYVSIPRFVPKLAVGTNYVPEDQLAYIHEGEAVIPKKFNSQEYFGNGNEETNSLLQTLIEKVENIEINPYTTVRDVGQASIDYIRSKNRQYGRSVFA